MSPINARLRFQRDKETAYEDRMQFNTCTDTNGAVTQRLHGRQGAAQHAHARRSAVLGASRTRVPGRCT